ncbi:MAG: hypothetical protein P1V51_22350 [Deltaproteobacteria bacterium]|nr:hypothetical protein [Deltaproteobacteria bacterium]
MAETTDPKTTQPENPPAAPAEPAQTGGSAPAATPESEASTSEGQAPAEPEGTLLGKQEPAESGAEGAEGDTKAEGDEPAPIELAFPEGVEVDQALLEEFKPLAAELGLDSEGAQRVADLYRSAIERQGQAAQEAVKVQEATWRQAAMKDEELTSAFGEKGLDSAIASARRALTHFGTPELAAELEKSGHGSNPEILRVLARVGAQLKEDTFEGPGSGGSVSTEEEQLRKDYPSMYAPGAKPSATGNTEEDQLRKDYPSMYRGG